MDNHQPIELEKLAFSPGQMVRCKTRFDEEYEGEVIAFDLQTRILVIKCPSRQNDTTRNDIHFLVLDSVADLKILKEPVSDSGTTLPTIIMDKVKDRVALAVTERVKLVKAVQSGVTEDGLRLFAEFSKKYDRAPDLIWKDQSIIVMDKVLINPPYKEANCQPVCKKTNQNSVLYVQQIVRKYWDDKK